MKSSLHYGIIGDGRVARHFLHYFSLLDLPIQQWSRRLDEGKTSVEEKLAPCDVLLLLISDSAIDPFIEAHPSLKSKRLIHFSGSLSSELAHGAHPLMSFGPILYTLEQYERIHFVCDTGLEFGEIFPLLKNPAYSLPRESKALYHSLCVLSGNFT